MKIAEGQAESPRTNTSLSGLVFQKAVRAQPSQGQGRPMNAVSEFGTNMAIVMEHSQSGPWTGCSWSSQGSVQAIGYPLMSLA